MRRAALAVVVLATAALLVACHGDPDQATLTPSAPTTTAAPAKRIARSNTGANVPAGTDVYGHTHAGDLSPAVAGVPTRVYVPNSESNTIDVIDPNTFTVVDHFPVGRLPQHVTPAWDLRTLYVDNDMGDSLTPIDPMSGKPGAPIPVADPYNLYFTPDGSRAIVVAERLHRLDFRDPKTWALIGSVYIPHSGADHLDFSADGKYLLISCEFSGWVVRVDVASMQITGELDVKGQPIDVKLSPDGRLFYVANQSRDGVSIIDGDAMKELAFVPTGKGAHGLYPSRDDTRLYVSNRGEGSVSVINFATRKVIATWQFGGSPDMGGVSADGKQLWLSGRYNGDVYVIDTADGHLLHTIKVGNGPHGLCLFPQPGRFSLGHTGIYR